MIALLIWVVPVIIESYPFSAEYYPLIVGVICVVTAISPAYIISFIMLDEKDEDVLTVIRIMPLPPLHFLAYRILFVFLFGFITSIITLSLSTLSLNILLLFLISLFISLIAPITALTIITYSRNKIEGLTFLKGINFLIILPVFSFFTGMLGKILMGVIPTFWIYHCLMNLGNTGSIFYLISGFIFSGLILIYLIRQFKAKIFTS